MSKRLEEVLEGREANYILPFFWLHGEDGQVLREEMARVQEAGIGAVCVEARPHPDFLGPKWWNDLDVIMDEARTRGMKVWILDDDHYPTGHAAGKVKQAPEELHRLFLGERHIDVMGPADGASLLLEPLLLAGLRPTYSSQAYAAGKNRLVAMVAVRRSSADGSLLEETIDLTDRVKDGTVFWDIPEGYWRVFIITENRDGGSKLQEDYLNPLVRESTQILIDTVYEAVYKRYKDDFGNTLAGFFSDEPGFYNDKETFNFQSKPGKPGVVLPWSSEVPVLLEQALGGEFRSSLYHLWYDAGKFSSTVRYHYMDAVSRLYGENFCNHIGEWCRARGVEYIGHVLEDNNVHARLGSGAGHFFRSLWGQDMSGLDVVLWQIVPGFDTLPFRSAAGETDSEFFHYGLAKLAVSLGHIDPNKQGRTMCEVYGAYGWAEGLKLMKWLTDHMLVRGVNRFVPHAFSPKAFPDPDCPPHLYAGGRNPQFRYYKYLNHYMNRVSHLFSGGKHIATAAVMYHAEAEWSGETMYFHKPVKELMQNQIDCDVLPVDTLLEAASVQDRRLRVHEEAYECLVTPYAEALPEAMLRRLLSFAEQGLDIYVVGGLPVRCSEGADVSDALSALAQHRNVKCLALDQLAQELVADRHYEIKPDSFQPYLRSYHYAHDGLDVFMFFNEHPVQTVRTTVTLPIQGDAAVYDAFLNRVSVLNLQGGQDVGEMQLVLEPYESILVVHGTGLTGYSAAVPGSVEEEVEMQNGWRISVSDALHYPDFQEWGRFDALENMSRPDRLPRFTGTFRYETEFEWKGSHPHAALDLGRVFETAEVWLNGVHAGTRISPPYRLDIGSCVRQGINKLVIEVTNTLVKEQHDYLSAFAQQEPSGLLGPVRIVSRA